MSARHKYRGTYETLAFDFASNRSYDPDGRLHVAQSNISRANICPYYGYEIPDHEKLGLQPYKTYRLLRDPEELRKAAPTFNNLPILDKHIHVTSSSPQKDNIVGTTGSSSAFDGEYLTNGTSFWTDDAIDGIESRRKSQLSSCYHYRADMTPGTHNGEAYDGRMTDIHGNHVAIVERGRAGSTVSVGDHAMRPRFFGFASKKFLKGAIMAKPNAARKQSAAVRPTRPAIQVFAEGVLRNYLSTRVAADAQIDLKPVLATLGNGSTINAKTFHDALMASVAPLNGVPRLAADADVADVTDVLEQLQDMAPQIADLVVGGPEALVAAAAQENPDGVGDPAAPTDPAATAPNLDPADPAANSPPPATTGGKDPVNKSPASNVADKKTTDDAPAAPAAGNADKVSDDPADPPKDPSDPQDPDDNATATGAVNDFLQYLETNNLSDEELAKVQAALENLMSTATDKTPAAPAFVSKTAMDQAIAAAEQRTIRRMNAVAEAKQTVLPYVGPIVVAMDSAEQVYRFTLKQLGVAGADKMHVDALLPVLQAQPRPGERARAANPRVAADAANAPKPQTYDESWGKFAAGRLKRA